MSIVAQIFPFAQSVRISSTRGIVQLSGTVLAFSSWKSQTHRGSTVLSAFGMMKDGEAYGDEDGRIKPDSSHW